jgi:hypothetical protein
MGVAITGVILPAAAESRSSGSNPRHSAMCL